ncbi:hypothetical protein CR513_54692, partial [Mucuna pruriens]
MSDIISCFNENAVNVSQSSSCSPSVAASSQNSVSSIYKTTLSNQNQLLITVTWCRTHSNQGLTIVFGQDNPTAPCFRLNTNSRFFRKKKGSKVVEFEDSKVEVLWDLSKAKYEAGPEPVDGFYVAIIVDAEIGLVLGQQNVSNKFKARNVMGNASLLSRREHCSGNAVYATKAQFCDAGTWHDILIRCSGDSQGLKAPALSVCIDKKTVIRVKRLHWNFRGNQTIFVDGLLVDLLWDVHNWFFNPASGYAVFMFRTRTGLDSRLWFEDKMLHKDQDTLEFSLFIYAFDK